MKFWHKESKLKYRFPAILLEQLSSHWLLIMIPMLLIIFIYYWLEWRTFDNFVLAIDRSPHFMYDFTTHYYPMGKQILQTPTPVDGYFYTSFFALVIEPISKQTLPVAMLIWGGIQILSLTMLFFISVRALSDLSKVGQTFYIGLCLTSFPILNNIKWGQVSLPIIVCTIASFLAFKQNKRILAGILLGLVTAVKLYPLYFGLYFIINRDTRTLISLGVSTIVFYFFFPFTVLGFENWLNFEKTTTEAIINSGWVSRDINSQYIVHVGSRWINFIFERSGGELVSSLLTMIGYLISISCIIIAWQFQKTPFPEKHVISLVSLFLITPFVFKTSWPHYFVYLPFCQISIICFFINYYKPTFTGKVLFTLPVFSILLSSIFLFNMFSNWSIYNAYGILFLSNLSLLIALYLLVVRFVKSIN